MAVVKALMGNGPVYSIRVEPSSRCQNLVSPSLDITHPYDVISVLHRKRMKRIDRGSIHRQNGSDTAVDNLAAPLHTGDRSFRKGPGARI